MFLPNTTAAWNSGAAWSTVVHPSPTQPIVNAHPQAATYPPQPFAVQAMQVTPAHSGFFAVPPSYPASNMPDMWNRLHPYISHSPTLRQQLAQAAQAGWSVQCNLQPGAFCDYGRRVINIEPAHSEALVMQSLAHEVRHAVDPAVETRFHGSDVAYASTKLRNEAIATHNHLQVRAEIFQGCGVDIGFEVGEAAYYEGAASFSQRHGNGERLLQHIQRFMTWEQTSVHRRCYWEVYLNEWRTERGWPLVMVPADLVEEQRGQARQALAGEIWGG